eukprot:4540190-Pyramimonas_sp.AAC.1
MKQFAEHSAALERLLSTLSDPHLDPCLEECARGAWRQVVDHAAQGLARQCEAVKLAVDQVTQRIQHVEADTGVEANGLSTPSP